MDIFSHTTCYKITIFRKSTCRSFTDPDAGSGILNVGGKAMVRGWVGEECDMEGVGVREAGTQHTCDITKTVMREVEVELVEERTKVLPNNGVNNVTKMSTDV